MKRWLQRISRSLGSKIAKPSEMLSIASRKRFCAVRPTTTASFNSRFELRDRLQGLFQLAGPFLDHAVQQDRGLEQMVGIALQVEAVLDMLHQGAVDLLELGDLALERGLSCAGVRSALGWLTWRGQIHRFTLFPKAMPVKVWLICMVPNCSP